MQVLQAKISALEMEENSKMPSVLSDPMKVPDVCVLQTGMPVAAAMPTHKPASAAVALKTSLDVPLLGQPLLEPSPQVLHHRGSLSINVSQMRLVLAPLYPTRSSDDLWVCMQRSAAPTPRAQRTSSMAGSDLDSTVFPLSVRIPGQSANSPDVSLSDSAGGIPTPQHMHSAASEAQALAQEAAQLKAQAQSYQARDSANP